MSSGLNGRGRLSPHKAFSASWVESGVLTGKRTVRPGPKKTINRDGSAPPVQVLQCAPDEIISATIFADPATQKHSQELSGRAQGVPETMSSTKSQLRLMGAFAALATLALAISCRGFFVKPTLSSLAVGPVAPSIFTGSTDNTVQMFAVGTFNDGSNGSTPVTWSISGTGAGGTAVATISPGGLVTAQATGTGTITAASNILPSITGTQPITVSVACTSAPVITPSSGSLSMTQQSLQFSASCNSGQDITAVATWFSSNTTIATINAGLLTATGTANADGTITITASSNGFTSTPVTVNVSGF